MELDYEAYRSALPRGERLAVDRAERQYARERAAKLVPLLQTFREIMGDHPSAPEQPEIGKVYKTADQEHGPVRAWTPEEVAALNSARGAA